MSMLSDIKRTKNKVGYLLHHYPPLRDDDKKLWVAYLNKFHHLESRMKDSPDPFDTLKRVLYHHDTPMFESISRVRRKFQENGEYVGLKRDKRLEEETKVREYFRA